MPRTRTAQHQGERTYYVYDADRPARAQSHRAAERHTCKKERIYLGGFEVYREYDGSGDSVTLERETLHVMDDKQRIALVETRTHGNELSVPEQLIRYQFSNHLGSASLELDDGGQIISYEEYYPYGSTAYQAGRSAIEVSLKRYRYTGMERDEESGLCYHLARYYGVWLGRWTSADRIGIRDGVNIFAYTRDNPLNRIDLSGNDTKDVERTDNYLQLLRESIEHTTLTLPKTPLLQRSPLRIGSLRDTGRTDNDPLAESVGRTELSLTKKSLFERAPVRKTSLGGSNKTSLDLDPNLVAVQARLALEAEMVSVRQDYRQGERFQTAGMGRSGRQ